MNELLVIERFEEEFAVCEDDRGTRHRLPRAWLPAGLREGDCLRETAAGYALDLGETQRRRAKNRALFSRLIRPRGESPHPQEGN